MNKKRGLIIALLLCIVLAASVGNEITVEAVSLTVRKPADFRLRNMRTRTVQVLAKRRGTIDGYEVRMRRAGSDWRTYTVYTHGNLARKYSFLVKNATYEFQVRSFRNFGGKRYGSKWSRVTKVRIKK